EGLGPTTAGALAASLGLRPGTVEAALAALEGEGFAMRGRFTPGGVDEIEWCDRRLLARIHRHTLERLRREIEPVSQAGFVRFLLAWQRVDPDARMDGPESIAVLLAQLEGFEAPAAAWEGEILPARMKEYDPLWLAAQCLAGRCVWGRVTPPAGTGGRRSGPVRATPVALVSRPSLALWQGLAAGEAGDTTEPELSADARAVRDLLRESGASFFGEIATGAGLLQTQVEAALGELVAHGLVTADSFTGLRALLVPAHKRPRIDRSATRGAGTLGFGMENAGRWSLLRRPMPAGQLPSPQATEAAARALLARYGVVFRRLVERESLLPPWRDLLAVFRRLEARGEIRGGRFVSGFAGEQYALPEAVGRLRALRKEARRGTLVSVSAADPLNLVGIATPGDRLPALAGNRLLYRDGEPIAVREGRVTRFLVELDPAERWQAESALVRRSVAPRLKAYLGRSA
ncbi:MAG TPA: ATP-dependent DNA helicase, partial [Thermoanaerobaculia bacterium]